MTLALAIGIALLAVRLAFAQRALRLARSSSSDYVTLSAEGIRLIGQTPIPWTSAFAAISAGSRSAPVAGFHRFANALLTAVGLAKAEFFVGLDEAAALRTVQPKPVHAAFVTTLGDGGLRIPVDNCLSREVTDRFLAASCSAAHDGGVPSIRAARAEIIRRWVFGTFVPKVKFDAEAAVAALRPSLSPAYTREIRTTSVTVSPSV